jgi:DNA-directed RNA polymerase subunit RPC12/RpoP
MESEVRIKRIVLNRMERCIVCHHQFHTDDITVISRESEMWTMLVECTDCHARNFVAAVLNDGDPEEAQLALRRLSEQAIRDLKDTSMVSEIIPDAPEASHGNPITASDVLEMYEFLETFDGDFKAVFGS